MWSNKEADFFPEINKSFTFPGMGQQVHDVRSHNLGIRSMELYRWATRASNVILGSEKGPSILYKFYHMYSMMFICVLYSKYTIIIFKVILKMWRFADTKISFSLFRFYQTNLPTRVNILDGVIWPPKKSELF